MVGEPLERRDPGFGGSRFPKTQRASPGAGSALNTRALVVNQELLPEGLDLYRRLETEFSRSVPGVALTEKTHRFDSLRLSE